MEFHEKLQELRKQRGLTQEELAQALYVSRTAVSKWESGRGYPGIDSLKSIARFFAVTIDDLLSGERLIDLAQKENQDHLHRLCGWVFAATDICAAVFAVLPLYPHQVSGTVYAVNLCGYAQAAPWVRPVYGGMIAALVLTGAALLLMTHLNKRKGGKILTWVSAGLSLVSALLFAAAREAYAAPLAVLMMTVKWVALAGMLRAER